MGILNPNTTSNSADGPLSIRRAVSIAAGLFCGVTLTLRIASNPITHPLPYFAEAGRNNPPCSSQDSASHNTYKEEPRIGTRSVWPPGTDRNSKAKKPPMVSPSTCTT